MVAVAQVQVGQQWHLSDDEAQRRVGDVEPRQTQVLNVTQLAAVIQLTCQRATRTHTDTQVPVVVIIIFINIIYLIILYNNIYNEYLHLITLM